MAHVAAQQSVFGGYGALSRINGTPVPSAPSSTRTVCRAISSPVAVPRTDTVSPRHPQVIVATSSSPPPQSPRVSHVERVVSSPAVCHQPSSARKGYPVSRLVSASSADVGPPHGSFRAPIPLDRGGSFRATLDRGGYPISRLVSSSSAECGGSLVGSQPIDIVGTVTNPVVGTVTNSVVGTVTSTVSEGAPVAVAGIDTNCDGEVDYLYVGTDTYRVGIPDVLQSSAKVNNLPTKTGSFTVPVLSAPSDVLASQPPGPLTAIVEGSGTPSAAMEAYLKSCFDWKRNPNNVFKVPQKASPRLESRPSSPPVLPRSVPTVTARPSPPVTARSVPASAPAVVLVAPRTAPSPVVRPAPPQSHRRSATPPGIGRFEREAQKLIDALEGGLQYSDLNTSSAGGTEDPQGYPSMLPSELESTCSGQETTGGLSVGTANGVRPAIRGEEVGIKRSLKVHAAKDMLDISDVEDIPELMFVATASESSQPSARGKSGRGSTIDNRAFSPRGSRDIEVEDLAGKIGYTNQFTAQQIFQASLKDGKKTEDGRKWVPPTRPRLATKEPVQPFTEDTPMEDRADDEHNVPRAEVEQKFQVSLRNHKPVKDAKRASKTSPRPSSMSTWSNSSKSNVNSGSTLRDSTLSSLMKGGSGSFRASVTSSRDRSMSGSAVKSRRNNTFDLAGTPEKDSPLTAARKALEREALEKADDRRNVDDRRRTSSSASRVSRMSSIG